MANFNNLALTAEGVKALLAAQAGTTLTLSKIGLGSGSTTSSSVNLKSLLAPELMMPISEKKIDSTSGHITLVAKMTNEGIAEGFYWRETGLFFEDSEGNDVLFAYSCTTSEYDYIPAYSDQRYVKHIRIANIITDSADITIKENEGLLYVDTLTYEDFKNEMEEHVSDTNNPHGVTPEKIGALNVVMKNNSVFKTLYGDHEYINKEIDDSIPVIPVTSNFLHILNIGPSGNVLAVISLPTDYSTTVYRYSRSDGEWIRLISQKDIVDNLVSTATNLPLSAKQGNVLDGKISTLDELGMIRRGALTSESVLADTKRGVHYCDSNYPSWLPCGWCYVYMPSNGTLNGAFVVSFVNGTSAGHYTYSNRYNKWINHDDVEALNTKFVASGNTKKIHFFADDANGTFNIDQHVSDTKCYRLVINGTTKLLRYYKIENGTTTILLDPITDLNGLLKRKQTTQYVAGTNGNNYFEYTIPSGTTLATYPCIQAILNTYIDGVYVVGATRVSDTVLKVYFNKAFTNSAFLAIYYTIA